MRLPETRDLFAQKLQFPTTRATVIETVGDTVLDAPSGESIRLSDVLERCGTDEFSSADTLYDTMMTFVGEEFIGRKYYDDRGGIGQSGGDEQEVNF
jgi:hypothetical protein